MSIKILNGNYSVSINPFYKVKWMQEYVTLHTLFSTIFKYSPSSYVAETCIQNVIREYMYLSIKYHTRFDFYIDDDGDVYLLEIEGDNQDLIKYIQDFCSSVIDKRTGGLSFGSHKQLISALQALVGWMVERR
jgi:hypothetical protein